MPSGIGDIFLHLTKPKTKPKTKSLKQITDEAVNVDPGLAQKIHNKARNRFLRDYKRRNKGDKNCTNNKIFFLWKNLPEEEKNKWKEEYLKEYELGKPKETVSNKWEGPEHCKSPFEVWYAARTAEGEEISSAEAKTKYSNILHVDKIPFIIESLKQQKVYEAEAAKYLEKNPTWKPPKARGPSDHEMKVYLKSIGMPTAPPEKIVIMYYLQEKQKFIEESENKSANDKRKEKKNKPFELARSAFSNFPEELKDQYKSDWKKAWMEYLSEVEKWKPMIEEKYPEILEKVLAVLAAVTIPSSISCSTPQ